MEYVFMVILKLIFMKWNVYIWKGRESVTSWPKCDSMCNETERDCIKFNEFEWTHFNEKCERVHNNVFHVFIVCFRMSSQNVHSSVLSTCTFCRRTLTPAVLYMLWAWLKTAENPVACKPASHALSHSDFYQEMLMGKLTDQNSLLLYFIPTDAPR